MSKYAEKLNHVVGSCCNNKKKSNNKKRVYAEKIVSFTINGTQHQVESGSVSSTLSLARFIRENVGLTGTKISCNQGGCGACVVTASVPNQQARKVISVNSCLTPVFNCDGWNITTVEGLGNKEEGMHPIQERLAAFHGTQCGFCSPGMVMQMNSLLEGKPGGATVEEIESVLDGNICRCTGYRPILDAFKSFSSEDVKDIEDVLQGCSSTKECQKKVVGKAATLEGQNWYFPQNLTDLLDVLKNLPDSTKYRLVAGNTGTGIFDKDEVYDAYVSVNKIPELVGFSRSPLELGGCMSLNAASDLLKEVAASNDQYKYGTVMAQHIQKIAHTSVRNVGTLAGNLMLKHAHRDFPSDLFVLLESIGAEVVVKQSPDGSEETVVPLDLLSLNMDRKIILKLLLPPLNSRHRFCSAKVMPRRQNAHAYVNGALSLIIEDEASFAVTERPNLVFGGISNKFAHATQTEAFLQGKSLKSIDTLKGALQLLANETVPDENPANASAAYRKHLVQALFYRFVLNILGDTVGENLRSGSEPLLRGLSSGVQEYETDPELYPVNQPVGKLEGKSQCTGEAKFANDIPPIPGELHAAFVLSTEANCDIDTVDPSPALQMPGVVAYLDHKDIPGKNSCVTYPQKEEIFSTGRILYAGQSIGLIVADSFQVAHSAARKVAVTYKNRQKPILTIKEALAAKPSLVKQVATPKIVGNVQGVENEQKKLGKNLHMVEGEFEIGSQNHFHMETQTVLVRPQEEGQMDVIAASQWMENVQLLVSQSLAIPQNLVNVQVRRLGGAYGGKCRITGHVAAAAAVAANSVKKPVRLVMDLQSNLEMLGKRLPYLAKYQAGVDDQGKLLYVSMIIYCDCGFSFTEPSVAPALPYTQNCYSCKAWNLVPSAVVTNTASNTNCRAPGVTQCNAIMENLMEHLAMSIGMDPLEFRVINLLTTGDNLLGKHRLFQEAVNPLPDIISQLRASSDYEGRLATIKQFNDAHRWKKKGISFVPCRYPFDCGGSSFYFRLTVFRNDGTIAISHGGIEMGQGINTKVAQTVAKELSVPMGILNVKPSDTFVSPNNTPSWGSISTDCVCTAAIIACQDLKARMQVVAESMDNPTWLELVQECYKKGVDLTARHMGYIDQEGTTSYTIWSSVVSEVEMDVLTGEVNIKRVDMLEDTGTSISPEVDVGQLEGSLIMSIGMWLTEQVKYHPTTGKLLTFDTWEYKPPCSQDIPEDLRTAFFDSKRHPSGVLGSKATGEPSFLLAVSVLFAIRRAIDSVKKDIGTLSNKWYNLDGPATVEKVQLTTGVTAEHFIL